MIQHTQSIIFDFHFPVDFRPYILFPHIFLFLHQNWVGIDSGWFTLTKRRHVGDEEKTIPSCLDTSSPTIARPVLPQSAFKFCALKKTDWPKLDPSRFKFLILVLWEKASPKRWGRSEFNASFLIGFGITQVSVLKSHFNRTCIGNCKQLYCLCERRSWFVRTIDLQKGFSLSPGGSQLEWWLWD